jgi:tryptophan halogenase
MKKIAVLGTGSAGIQTLALLLKKLNMSWEITSIYDPNIPILGIGESTNPAFMQSLYWGARLTVYEAINNKDLESTLKIGSYFKKWRDKDFINPMMTNGVAIHLNTFKLKDFAFERFREKWNKKFKEVLGNVSSMQNLDDKVSVIVDGQEHLFDYVIDCRGSLSNEEDYIFVDNPVNYCLVHNKKDEITDEPYTHHTATKDGWMFVIPLTTRTSYGYLFNTEITSIEEAKQNFSDEINVPIDQLDDIQYPFKSYYAKKVLDGRILKNGSYAYFIEPMFANSMAMYNRINETFVEYLNKKITKDSLNQKFHQEAESAKDMILYLYHGGSKYDTEFWQKTKAYASEQLKKSESFNRFLFLHNKYVEDGLGTGPGWIFTYEAVLEMDRNMGYNYFK